MTYPVKGQSCLAVAGIVLVFHYSTPLNIDLCVKLVLIEPFVYDERLVK